MTEKARTWRRLRPPRWVLIIMILALPLLTLTREWLCRESFEGTVTVVPAGAQLMVGSRRVRLEEVAVAGAGPLAAEARATLSEIALGKDVRCVGCARGEGAALVGGCELEDGAQLARLLVEAGVARDCPAASGGRLASLERERAQVIALPERCRPWVRRGPRPPLR